MDKMGSSAKATKHAPCELIRICGFLHHQCDRPATKGSLPRLVMERRWSHGQNLMSLLIIDSYL